jgi:hypothetical protein
MTLASRSLCTDNSLTVAEGVEGGGERQKELPGEG